MTISTPPVALPATRPGGVAAVATLSPVSSRFVTDMITVVTK
jgi:hypothetical protein